MARDTAQLDSERVGMTRKGSLSDMVMEFFEEMEGEKRGRKESAEAEYDENEGSIANLAEDEIFWTSQYNDLQVSPELEFSSFQKFSIR